MSWKVDGGPWQQSALALSLACMLQGACDRDREAEDQMAVPATGLHMAAIRRRVAVGLTAALLWLAAAATGHAAVMFRFEQTAAATEGGFIWPAGPLAADQLLMSGVLGLTDRAFQDGLDARVEISRGPDQAVDWSALGIAALDFSSLYGGREFTQVTLNNLPSIAAPGTIPGRFGLSVQGAPGGVPQVSLFFTDTWTGFSLTARDGVVNGTFGTDLGGVCYMTRCSFQGTLTAVPEPSSLLALVAGVAALAVAARPRRRAARR
jgi:hypothetical protein